MDRRAIRERSSGGCHNEMKTHALTVVLPLGFAICMAGCNKPPAVQPTSIPEKAPARVVPDFRSVVDGIKNGDVSALEAEIAKGLPAALNLSVGQISPGASPLHVAAESGNVGALTALIDHGVEADLSALSGETPLIMAASSGKTKAVELLLARGADVNKSSKEGTPLMVAAAAGQTAVVKLLCEKGATMNTEPPESSPLMLAASAGHVDVVRLLIKQGAAVSQSVAEPVKAAHPDIYRLLSATDPEVKRKRLDAELNELTRQQKYCNAAPNNCSIMKQLELMKRSNQIGEEIGRLVRGYR